MIVLGGNNWMHGTNQPLSLKEVNYRMSYLNFSWQILRWKVYALSQLITLVWKAIERNESCCNRNGDSKPNGKCLIARYGKNEQREVWIIRCGYWCFFEYHCSTLERLERIKSRMRFPPLLVNNQSNSSNVIVIVNNGKWILNNQTSSTNITCP